MIDKCRVGTCPPIRYGVHRGNVNETTVSVERNAEKRVEKLEFSCFYFTFPIKEELCPLYEMISY